MSAFRQAVQAALELLLRRDSGAFGQAAFRQEQQGLLQRLLAANRSSAYGRLHGFAEIDGLRSFRERVPLVTYEDLAPFLERLKLGEQGVLTCERVRLLEPTGGSSGPEKLIPYTRTLQEEFRRALNPWLDDLFRAHPGVRGGRSYWQVTPHLAPRRRTPGGIPVGFEDDSEYLGRLGGALLDALMVRPAICPGMDAEAFYTETLRALLAAEDLRLVSLWNPSLFLRLLDFLDRQPERVLDRLSPRRRQALRQRVLERDHAGLWPSLAVVSCWTDGLAGPDAEALRTRFPQAVLQPKGLLATEAVVTIPLTEALEQGGGMVPAWRSHFLEFLDGHGSTLLLHELEAGRVYEVVVTTGGGLYRYRLGDRVRVTGFWRELPLLRFEGRDRVVDLYGEKLSEGFVQEAFRDLEGFYLVAPCRDRYVLYAEAPLPPDEVDGRLRRSYHYDLARRLGQLAPARVFRLTGPARSEYLTCLQGQGQKLGDVKPTVLSPRQEWAFTGEEVPR